MQDAFFSEVEVTMTKHRQALSDMLCGYAGIQNFPEGVIYRKTPMVGTNKTEQSRVAHWPEDLETKIMSQPIESLKLRTIAYMTGKWFGCIGFTMSDGTESPKYGDKHNFKTAYCIRQDSFLRKIAVHYNNEFIVGLSFVYQNEEVDDLMGADYENMKGPLRTIDFVLEDGEAIVGVTVDQCDSFPRRIGFTFMRI